MSGYSQYAAAEVETHPQKLNELQKSPATIHENHPGSPPWLPRFPPGKNAGPFFPRGFLKPITVTVTNHPLPWPAISLGGAPHPPPFGLPHTSSPGQITSTERGNRSNKSKTSERRSEMEQENHFPKKNIETT